MSITRPSLLPGQAAIARNAAPATNPALTQDASGGVLSPRSHLVGRRGHKLVLDRLIVTMETSDWVQAGTGEGFLLLRTTNQNGGALATKNLGDLLIGVFSGTAGQPERYTLDMDKFGYAPDDEIASDQKEWPSSIAVARFDTTPAAIAATTSVTMRGRYVNQLSEGAKGLKKGLWGSWHTLSGSPVAVAAPGVGFYLRVHTLILMGHAVANATTNLITMGSDGVTPANAPIRRWRNAGANNRSAIRVAMTDIDIPFPENTPVAFSQAGFGAPLHSACAVVGAEICPLPIGNHISKSNTPT